MADLSKNLHVGNGTDFFLLHFSTSNLHNGSVGSGVEGNIIHLEIKIHHQVKTENFSYFFRGLFIKSKKIIK